MGFTLKPMTEGDLAADIADPFPHPVEEDDLYKMCLENKDGANKLVQKGEYEQAVARYSELIMQSRALDKEDDIVWTEDGRNLVRLIRAAAYLNLSLCFLKQKSWTHASNCATRALQGDKEPVDPKEDCLAPEKKAKALWRRAEAQMEGFGDFDKAKDDLTAALAFTPNDKAIQQQLKKVQIAVSKVDKKAEKKMAGFLNNSKGVKSGEGIFDDKDRERDTSAPKLEQPVKLSDGLFLVPKDEKEESKKHESGTTSDGALYVDQEELAREIKEMREENPAAFNAIRDKAQELVEDMVKKREATGEDGTGADLPDTAMMQDFAKNMTPSGDNIK